MINSIGTIFIAAFMLMTLTLLWFSLSTFIYFIVTLLVGINFSFSIASIVFLIFITMRMFYPRNVFI